MNRIDLQLNDSIRNERVRTRVAELDMRYRQDTIVMRKELVIEKQKGEMEVLKLTTYIWALIGIVSVIVAGLVYWYMKKKRMFLQERHINQISRFRMENIRNRLSPHFTFNVLNREISRFRDGETLCGDHPMLLPIYEDEGATTFNMFSVKVAMDRSKRNDRKKKYR